MKKVFLQDDDGHWYLVPSDQVDKFLLCFSNSNFDDSFQKYSCNHPSCYEVEIE